MPVRFPELGFYTLPGHVADPRPMLQEVRDAEAVGTLLEAYAKVRPTARFAGRSAVPGL